MTGRESTFTRRTLFARGGAMALVAGSSGLLSACGSGGGDTVSMDVGGTMRMVSWEGYDLPEASQPWRTQDKVTLAATYVGSNDEIVAKVAAAQRTGSGIDIITYAQGFRDQLGSLDLLNPLDLSKIPNAKNLFPFFSSDYKNFWVDPDGTVRGIPFLFGWNGITYDSDVVAEPDTYQVLFEPKYKGRVAVNEDAISIFQIAARNVNVNPAQMNEADFAKVTDWVKQLLGQTKGVSPTIGDMVTRLASGDVTFAIPGWPGINPLAAAAGKKSVKSVLPREGGTAFCDAWAIPKSAKNVGSAYAWIDFTLDPKTSARTAVDLVGGTPVKASAALIPKASKEGYDYNDIQALFEKAPMYPNPPVKSDTYKTLKDVNDAWTQLKAAS